MAEIKVEVLKQFFNDLSIPERVEFVEWLLKHPSEGGHNDYIEFAQLGPNQRRVWNHYFQNISEGMGILSKGMSGGK